MPLHRTALALLDRTGPMAVTSANRTGQPAALTCDEAEEQLGEAISIYLDGGPVTGGVASTIVDATGAWPRLLRVGAISLDRLREVVADLDPLEDPSRLQPEVPPRTRRRPRTRRPRRGRRVREYLFVLVMAAAVTYVATPLVRWFAFKVGALAPVRDRDVHAEPMPRLGGVGMFLGFASAVLLACAPAVPVPGLRLGRAAGRAARGRRWSARSASSTTCAGWTR